MSKMNVKESLLEVVKSNNLEILKIDLFNDFELFVREGTRERNEYCKTYATLDDLDFDIEAFLLNDEVRGIVYCQDKDTKEPVWIEPCSDECYSWWQVSRVPKFYKRKTLNEVKLLLISARNRFRSAIDYWWSRRYWYKLEFDQLRSKDHSITKAISLIKKVAYG